MKILLVGADLFNVGRESTGRTDIRKLTVAFRNFAKAPKKFLYLKALIYNKFLSLKTVNMNNIDLHWKALNINNRDMYSDALNIRTT